MIQKFALDWQKSKDRYKVPAWFGPVTLLALALTITAKLSGLITWPWLWVLSPVWLPSVIGLPVLVIAMAFWVVVQIILAVRP